VTPPADWRGRLGEAACDASALVDRLFALGEHLGAEAAHGGKVHGEVEHLLELAVRLRSDLRRLARFADAATSASDPEP
jgi:hypothetical protein